MSRNNSYIWVPWESGYKEHLDRMNFSHDQVSAIKEQTDQFKNAIRQQTSHISDQTTSLIASNEQIISALDSGFNRLSQINERGFDQVTSAVESLHSSMVYYFGVVIQKLEFQNRLLGEILKTLQNPRETEINELYREGCEYIKQDTVISLNLAEECFKESITLPSGNRYFLSHYTLGRLYLEGLKNPEEATKYLLRANDLIDGKERVDSSFAGLVADCKFFLSKSYYSQLTGKNNADEIELLNNAIKYCLESVLINPLLSQGYYHLAKYSSYALHKFELNEEGCRAFSKSLLKYIEKAVNIEREYLLYMDENEPSLYDGVLYPNRKIISELIAEITEIEGDKAEYKLAEAKNKIAQFKTIDISNYPDLQFEFNEALRQFQFAEKDFKTGTYFGFDDCQLKLDN